jgi:hypothetical protein
MIGGAYLLTLLASADPDYLNNHVRQDLFRAGHAHAGVLLVLSLVVLRYIDEARLSEGTKVFVRTAVPLSAIFLPAAFFFSVWSPSATQPNGFIYLAAVGALLLAPALLILGVGLLRATSGPGEAGAMARESPGDHTGR